MGESGVSVFLLLGLFLGTGMFLGLLASRVGFPRVTAYIVAGVFFSPELLGSYPLFSPTDWYEPITSAALGIIAYIIGGSITPSQLRRMGRLILASLLGESLGALFFVFLSFSFLLPLVTDFSPFVLALAFATISTTTAPASTVAVLHQYRATGILPQVLLGVVALDDALGIILYSLVMIVAGGGPNEGRELLALPLELGGSLLLGMGAAFLLVRAGRRVHQSSLLLPVVLGGIFLTLGAAESLSFSPLLSCMVLGFFARLLFPSSGERLFVPIEYFEELVFILFFTLAGAHFEFHVFAEHFLLVAVYTVARLGGKIVGASAGAWAGGASRNVRRWLGFGLAPQAGVAVGLALTLSHNPVFQEMRSMIVNVILGSTLINELLGPLAVKFALRKSGGLQ